MPQKGDTQVNNFVKGYITEASPLNFPEGASLDEVNMKLKRDGTRERRLGLDYEDSYALQPTGQTAAQLAASRQRAFVWPTPSGFTDVEIGVIQIGTKLYFIDLFTENPSANVLNSGNAFDASTASSVIDNTAVFDFALINNNLIVVSSGLDTPFILYYDGDTDTVTWDTARIEIRDLYGVTDGLDDDERPTTLSDAHEYNLRNQGWNTNIVTKNGAEVLTETFNGIGGYPSNSDTWSLGKIADVTDADVDKYDAETLKRNSFDIGRAPRGHYIIDLYNRGNSRETLTGLTMPTVDREVRRISTVAAMGGRLFYSGINSKVVGKDISPKLSGAVLFSQIAKSDADLVKCYQEADPTSPNSNELVDTDGGVIFITEASNITKIQNTQGSILVFADNGVWEIRGDEGGFRATSFQVNKISNIGVIARESIVDANGTIYFWGKDGIFTMTPNQLGTGYDTVNITLNTIQSAFNTLPDFTKRGVKAYYDDSANSIRWLFNLDSDNVIDIPAPAPPAFEVGTPAEGSTGREPETINVNSTTAFTVYADSTYRYIYYQVSTINTTTLEVTLGTETELVDTGITGGATGWTVERLSDNRIVAITTENPFTTKARLITFSGSTPTVGSPTTINSVFGPISQTGQLRTAPIDSERFLVRCRNLTNGVGSMQVVKVVGSTISFGTVVSTATQNHLNTKVCMLTSTFCMYSDNIQNSAKNYNASFTVSDTSITLNTESTDPEATDFPSGTTNVQSYFPDIQPISSTRAALVGTATISNATLTDEDGIMLYKLAASSTDVLVEAATMLTDPTVTESTTYCTSIYQNNSLWAVYMDNAESPVKMKLVNYILGDPATVNSETTLDTATTFELHPEATYLGNNIMYIAYREASPSDVIKGIAARIT